MNVRLQTVQTISKPAKHPFSLLQQNKKPLPLGSLVFGREQIEALPKKVARNWLDTIDGKAKFDPAHADTVASALRIWALEHGATHFAHWFQPLTNAAAEKHDSLVENFSGKELLRGEPDASSFPHGGLRATHEARGYTVWDPTAFPFLWEGADGATLCIPALFFSWKGDALDYKIPLLRSEDKLDTAVMRLLKLCNVPASSVHSTLGIEQEYFLIDRSLYLLRPDLLLSGRTVFGAKPPKTQELEDHYFGAPKERVLSFMRDFEEAARKLAIPLRTRHNEVAPAQHETAPLFEKASIAIDHNLQLMELMRQIAARHDLACLFHEKPFQGINGSGKHNNWSIATNTGLNLLDPKENSLVFLTLLTAVLRAVHEHAPLLRASIASAGNDHRLGGSEAPPTILSVYLGNALQSLISDFLQNKKDAATLPTIDLGLKSLPRHAIDASDRNRTSFFAFTGNKFEFRAVGASAHSALPITIINAIVAESLHLILDEIADVVKDTRPSNLFALAAPVLRKHLSGASDVLFEGNNYSSDWHLEATRRNLPNLSTLAAYAHLTSNKAVHLFQNILTAPELHSRQEVFIERYAKTLNIELNLSLELFYTQVLPTVQKDCRQRGQELPPILQQALDLADELKKNQGQLKELGYEARAKIFMELLLPKQQMLRIFVDELETMTDNALWPLPKYREMLFLI